MTKEQKLSLITQLSKTQHNTPDRSCRSCKQLRCAYVPLPHTAPARNQIHASDHPQMWATAESITAPGSSDEVFATRQWQQDLYFSVRRVVGICTSLLWNEGRSWR